MLITTHILLLSIVVLPYAHTGPPPTTDDTAAAMMHLHSLLTAVHGLVKSGSGDCRGIRAFESGVGAALLNAVAE